MNAQTIAETHRILAVIDDLLEDLDILALLPPYLSAVPPQDMQHITNAFKGTNGGREAQAQLNDHFDLERKLESAAGDVSADDIADHHLSTRSLVDTLRQAGYPHYEAAYPPNESIENYRSIIAVLRSLLNDRFNTTVEDDVIKFAILNDTVNREKSASADVQALNREYQNEKESRRIEVEKRDIAIRKLREEIAKLEESSRRETEEFLLVSEQHAEADRERYRQEIEGLDAKQQDMAAGLRSAEVKCGNEENQMRGERSKKEKELEQIIDSYDKEMTTLTTTVETLEAETKQDQEETSKLAAKLETLNKEDEEHKQAKQIELERKDHRQFITVNMENSSRVIQAFWRSHAVRLHAAQKGKKKGKKK